MRTILLLCLYCLIHTTSYTQQCFSLLDCFVQPDTGCHLNANQITFWNESYWYSSTYATNDLPEAMTDLQLTLNDNCFGDVSVSFTLLLDIDNNQVLETAIVSDSLPPANTVMFGNALNPNYSGGEARAFDERLVPQNAKYGFAYQRIFNGLQVTNRVRWVSQALPNQFVDPALPYGKHKIIWTIQYDSLIQTCTRDIVVRDCKEPIVTCLSGATVNIGTNGTATFGIIAALQGASDNMTTTPQLMYGMRKKGNGSGFPVGPSGQNAFDVKFDCIDVGLFPTVELWVKDKAGNLDSCHTIVNVEDPNTNCTLNQALNVCVYMPSNEGIETYECLLEMIYPGGDTSFLYETSFQSNCIKFTQIPNASNYRAIPSSNENWLNGLSTYDLVLISRHILGIDTLNTPFKLIAADANQSGSITTFDNVLYRKLILGIDEELSNTNSWQFIDKNYVFQNPLNPFLETPAASISGSGLSFFADTLKFTGIKMGDVNNSAMAQIMHDEESDDRNALQCFLPEQWVKKGEIIEVPIFLKNGERLEGFQLGIQTDPSTLIIKGIFSNLSNFDQNSYYVQPNGNCRISWIGDTKPATILPNQSLMTFQMEAQKDFWLSEGFRVASDFRSEAYDLNLVKIPITVQFEETVLTSPLSKNDTLFPPQPNPTTGKIVFPVALKQDGMVHLHIMDTDGHTVYFIHESYESGNHLIEIPDVFLPISGLYFWKIQGEDTTKTGKFIKY